MHGQSEKCFKILFLLFLLNKLSFSGDVFTYLSTYGSRSLYMKSAGDGTVYAQAGTGLIKSSDFGRTWIKLNLDVYPYFVNSFDISSNNRIICTGTSAGQVHVSYDSGNNFELIGDFGRQFIDAVKVVNDNTFLVGLEYDQTFCNTNNCDVKVMTIQDTLIKGVTDIATDNSGFIYLSTFDGIFRSTFGQHWSAITEGLFDIKLLRTDQYSNLYAATYHGAIYSSVDHGMNWEMISESLPNNTFIWGFTITSDGYLFLGSQDKGLYRKSIDLKTPEITAVSISRNFPNPFNNLTRILYDVPEYSFVEVKIFNLLGKKVASLISECKAAGEYFVEWQPIYCSSGVYFYTIQVGSKVQTGKKVFLK